MGVREVIPHRAHADPGLLLDRVFTEAIILIDDLMRLTPVERLPGVSADAATDKPPADDQVFGAWTRHSIRWQLGF